VYFGQQHLGSGVMTSLNLSSNTIGSEGAVHVAEAIKVRNCVVAVVLVPKSGSSDHWFNCCCLLLSIEYGGTIISEFEQQYARTGDWVHTKPRALHMGSTATKQTTLTTMKQI
jgi:hypothetical protein